MDFTLRRATARDLHEVASMAGCMWHSATIQELETEFSAMIQSEESAVFLAFSGQTVCGFAQCGLRRDYVEGTHTSPVGYLEGIYVKPEFRKCGIARALLAESENWAAEKGCREFASDCELTNSESLRFHLNVGFEEANRIICFTKKL